MKIINFQNEEEFIQANLRFLEGAKNIALSGGSTPISTYQAMRNINAEFYQVDERYVPSDHPDSNQKIIKKALQKDFHHFDTQLPIQESLKKYEAEIANVTFDICILGIGPDGHTASIFPNTPEHKSLVAHTQTKEFAIKDRLTITLKKILQSKKLLILLKNKSQILEKLKSQKDLPAHNLFQHPYHQVHHVLDH